MIRDLVLFTFLTGLRLGEVVNLQWENVDIDNRTITIGCEKFSTKNKKFRVIPLCDEAFSILQKYYNEN